MTDVSTKKNVERIKKNRLSTFVVTIIINVASFHLLKTFEVLDDDGIYFQPSHRQAQKKKKTESKKHVCMYVI